MLRSDDVLAETRSRLAEQADFDGATLPVRSELVIDADGSRSMLRLSAQAPSPELASVIANTWAEVMVELSRNLSTAVVRRSIALAESRYDNAHRKAMELEAELAEMLIDFEDQSNAIAARWQDQIVAATRETEEMVAAYQIETRQMFDDIVARRRLATGAASFPGSEALRRKLLATIETGKDLAQTLPYVVLEKSVSDDALWQWMGDEAAGAEPAIVRQLADLTAIRLQDRAINPLYVELQNRFDELENDLLESVADWGDSADLLAEIEHRYQERRTGLINLRNDRSAHLSHLRAGYRIELETLRYRHQEDLARLRRQIDEAVQHLGNASSSYEEAELAKAELESTDHTIAVMRATPPTNPVSRHLLLKGIGALVVGALIGLVLALLRETMERGQEPRPER
jgi:capsular polysaccharide biosynthesis protein